MAKWPTDKELEEIYRRGSESHGFPYDPKAWDQMNLLLDRRKRRKWVFIFLFGLFLLMAVAFFYLSLQNDNGIRNQNAPVTNEISYSDAIHGESGENLSEKLTNPNLEFAKEANEVSKVNEAEPGVSTSLISENSIDAEEVNQLHQEKTEESVTSISNANKLENQRAQPTSGKDQFNNSSTRSDSGIESNLNLTGQHVSSDEAEQPSTETKKAHTITTTHAGENTLDQSHQIEKVDQNIPTDDELSTLSENKSSQSPLTISYLDGRLKNVYSTFPFAWPKTPQTEELSDNEPDFTRLTFDLLLNAESSWTPNGSFSSIDMGIGLGSSYFINSRIGISLSATYIKDVYTAMQGDYHPPKGYWENKGAPDWTAATCQMIETSLGLSYHFNPIDQNGLGISTNVLSNFMLNEMYYYHFTEQENNFSNSWSMANHTWFSALSISTDYRFLLGNKWRIHAGPYVKIPFQGIGHGKVKLASFGLRLRLSLKSG